MGPACEKRETLAAMLDAGMDVARFNMSHGTYEQHAETIATLRDLARERERPLALLQDLSGPKIRLGHLEEPKRLQPGDRIQFGGPRASGDTIPVNLRNFARHVAPGDTLSLADGLFRLKVSRVDEGQVEAEVIEGSGVLTSHKGVNLPQGGQKVRMPTPKDRRDLQFGLEQDFDWIALSFVRSARDAEFVRAAMKEAGKPRPVLAKIEKPEAVERAESIVAAFDGLMVARGDLGVETALERVPGIQKRLIRLANDAAKPVITATQMLLSMVSSPTPTRAEVADVTAAVLDGTDAVMVSEETAQGRHPVEVVRTLARICVEAERLRRSSEESRTVEGVKSLADGIGRTVPHLARLIGAKLIVAPTVSGMTARRVAAMRPGIPILAISSNPETVRALSVTWGVIAFEVEEMRNTDGLFKAARAAALSTGLAAAGDRIVITAGTPTGEPGSTDLLKVEVL